MAVLNHAQVAADLTVYSRRKPALNSDLFVERPLDYYIALTYGATIKYMYALAMIGLKYCQCRFVIHSICLHLGYVLKDQCQRAQFISSNA